MNAKEITILIVDDEYDTREFHKALLLPNGYKLIEAKNGFEALKMLSEEDSQIDVILSDVIMPEKNGYEFCRQVKEQKSLNDIPFIFISSLTSLEEKAKGYSFGADEYVNKPLEVKELDLKITNLLRRRERYRELNIQIEKSLDSTINISTFHRYIGLVLDFFELSAEVKTTNELARLIFDVTRNIGLNCTLQFRFNDGLENFSEDGEVQPLEINVIELARKKEEKYYRFSTRLVVSFQAFSLLIKNLPVENEERTDMLIDLLRLLSNSVDTVISRMNVEFYQAKKNIIADVIQTGLELTQSTVSRIESENVDAINVLMFEIEKSFMKFGLSDIQEKKIRFDVANCKDQIRQSFKQGETLDSLFENIRDNLDQIDRTST